MSELALILFAENKKSSNPFLDLGNCGLKYIPHEIGELEWLETLSFAKVYWILMEKNGSVTKLQTKAKSTLNFKKKLSSLGHFHTSYDPIEHLKLQFNDQLVKLHDVGI